LYYNPKIRNNWQEQLMKKLIQLPSLLILILGLNACDIDEDTSIYASGNLTDDNRMCVTAIAKVAEAQREKNYNQLFLPLKEPADECYNAAMKEPDNNTKINYLNGGYHGYLVRDDIEKAVLTCKELKKINKNLPTKEQCNEENIKSIRNDFIKAGFIE
jgi:hypothetical protein